MESNQNYLPHPSIMEKKQTDLYMTSLLKRKSTTFFIKLRTYNLVSYLIIPSSGEHEDERNLYFTSVESMKFLNLLANH